MHEEYVNGLVKSYIENKELADRYKKLCDAENKELKEELTKEGLTEYSWEGYTVKLSTAVTESMDEAKALEWAHEHDLTGVIKTKEVLDYEALEGMIYRGEIPSDVMLELNRCRLRKETTQLRISKKK